jgi:hypothetical protein
MQFHLRPGLPSVHQFQISEWLIQKGFFIFEPAETAAATVPYTARRVCPRRRIVVFLVGISC